ncbi:asparaginase [Paracoccus tibetensis]|uniref:L-asparaginase n=1 Tax=Paracoccus tibetensis TaxID=336292 RepID=A0A1G5EUG8_9RHOB|nr:asparaginase domain-containing protein [Paracoccus tibetensis]SCY30320.1 L-asparaginase [Paracoccus tibetensis]
MKVCIINTGGTISSVGAPLAPMPPADFARAAEELLGPALRAALPGVEACYDGALSFAGGAAALDSTDLRPSDWCRIAGRVLDLYDSFDGFVILHGTDTMDYSGTGLALLLNVPGPFGLPRATLSKPLILTGAQLPLFRQAPEGLVLNAGSDAFANLSGALQAATLRLPEVGVFFDGRLLRGSRALKVSTRRFAAFDSPHLPPLAESGIGIWHGAARPLPSPAAPKLALDHPDARALVRAQLEAVAARIDALRVPLISAVPADHRADAPLMARLVEAALDGAAGLVLEGFGEGNIPAGLGAMEAALRAASVLVVIASRPVGGRTGAFHYAAGAWIAQTGAIGAGDMTPVAAVAKLLVLTAAAPHHGWDLATLAALMTRSLVGERAALDRMEAPLLPGMRLQAADAAAELVNDPDSGPRLAGWQAPGPGRLEMRGAHLVLVAPDGAATELATGPGQAPLPVLTAAGLMLVDPSHREAPILALPC